ncbi:MAG: acetate--CoA ligase family protein [Gammaproteobacteria bacterium]|nr:acetate--CoA ligase family protein [Gammaproteobacteria bacterium]
MSSNDRYQRLQRLFDPRSIAFVGGSALEPAIAYSRALGFDGDYHVIHPRRDELAGIACVASAAELARAPDVAFVAVPASVVVDAVRDLAEAGVGAAVINSSGFSEAGDNGRELEAELSAAAGDMPFLGPNCPGVANFLDGVGLMLDHFGDCDHARGVAVLSNGGAWLADISNADRSLPVAYLAGLGNQANVSIAELLEVVLDDERVSAVNLHIEGLRDVQRLSQCALKAHRRGIPVVVIKAGRSHAGERAARSHTASLAGDAEIASALFRRLGFVEVESTSEALETLKMLTVAAAPRGPRTALATSSGTYAVIGADFAERFGLVLPQSSERTRGELKPLLHDFNAAANPLDIATAQFWPDARQRELFECFLQDDYDLALQIMSFPAPATWDDESWYRSARVFAEAAASAGLPAAFVAPVTEGLPRPARELLIDLGVAPLQGYREGFAAIAHALEWHRRRKRLDAHNLLLPAPPPPAGSASVSLDEADAKALLATAGIEVPFGVRWDFAADAPAGLRYPVVLKACDPALAHKSDIGAVSLNLADADLLRFAREQMLANLERQSIEVSGLLIEETIHGGVAELLIGLRRIDSVGLVLTLAIGGIAVEVLRDSVTLLLPCDTQAIHDALGSLRLYPLLAGLRGGAAADIDAAVAAIEALAELVLTRNDIVEVEINPLLLRGAGHGAAAADAVVRLQPQ